MEGLEISVLNLSELIIENKIFRIDSEFQLKEYVKTLNRVKSLNNFTLGSQLELLTDGKHGGVTLTENGVVFLRTTNIKENEIDLSDKRFISVQESEETLRAEFKENDLLLTTIGTIGLCAKVPKLFPRATINQNLVRIVLKDKSLSSFICCFLNSKYGKNQLLRFGAGNVYQMINYPNLKKVLIPSFNYLSKKIEDLYLISENKKNKSKRSYTQAENLLLEEIGLQDFTPSKEPVNIKSFKDSFGTSGRLDAEYYQPKFEQVVNKVKNKPFDILSNLVEISKSIEPGSKNYVEKGLPFMRVADLSKNGLTEPQKYISEYFVKENQDKINSLKPKKGTILFSKDGSVGIAYLLRQDYNGITSGAILHLNVKDEKRIIPEYLTLALNSIIVQMQAERDAGGSIILHWSSNEIENVVVPIIDYDKQQQIAELIAQSFTLKKESEHLLEVAKRAVEIAIEESETVALEFIKKETA